MLEEAYYVRFADDAADVRSRLRDLLDGLVGEGRRVAGYGAAAKGAILLNFCGIDGEYVDYIVDRNTHKHGLEMPGVPIPIFGVERLANEPPDYLLILAWNFKHEIMNQLSGYSEQGGRFIIPIPTPVVI